MKEERFVMSIVWVTLLAGAAAFGTAGLLTLAHAAKSGAFENVEETKFVVFRGESDSDEDEDAYDEPPQ